MKIIERMKKIRIPILAILLISLMVSCSNDDDDLAGNAYRQTIIPDNIEDLYQAKGTATLDTVIVYSPGGPEPMLHTTDLEEPGYSQYYRVYVAQAQHLNSSIAENEITFEQAIVEDEISTDIFYKVLQHFKDQGKTVIAMSHSFGSFILPNVLVKYPNIADKVVIQAGRLDMPEQVWQGFRDGNTFMFENGTDITPSDSGLTGVDLTSTRLQAGLGQNRYTELLADKDINNMLYVHGTFDEPVGRLTQEEQDFLIGKDANVLTIPEGHHGIMFHPDIIDIIVDWIRE